MNTLNLSTLANLAEIIGTSSILIGLIVGWFQIRQYRAQQRDAIAMNLAQTFYSRDLAGGVVETMSRKLTCWQEDTRVEQNQPSWGEWFEWLGGQARNRKNESAPAHIRYLDWKP